MAILPRESTSMPHEEYDFFGAQFVVPRFPPVSFVRFRTEHDHDFQRRPLHGCWALLDGEVDSRQTKHDDVALRRPIELRRKLRASRGRCEVFCSLSFWHTSLLLRWIESFETE
jgi:hypothetical protein